VPRGIAKAPAVDFKMLDNNIAYVRVPCDSGKAQEARKDLDDLLKRRVPQASSGFESPALVAMNRKASRWPVCSWIRDVGYAQGQKVEKRTLTVDPRPH